MADVETVLGSETSSMTALEDFFTDDDGYTLLSASSQTASIRSVDSLASVAEEGSLSMPLDLLCKYIEDHQSLSNATIVSASTYNQRTSFVVKHRFLVVHLRRERKRDIWLRLDRLRSRDLAALGFLAAGGQVAANDVATVASSKELLIMKAKQENLQIYNVPPLLSVFRRFLLVIVKELVTYKLTSDNCWMFASTLQEHLGVIGKGEFTFGGPQHPSISKEVRTRIRRQVSRDYPVLFYARAWRNRTADYGKYEMELRENDLVAIVKVHDDKWWEGIHVDAIRDTPLCALVRSSDLNKVPSPGIPNAADVIFYAITCDQPSTRVCSKWDLEFGLCAVIGITDSPKDGIFWKGFIEGNTSSSDDRYLVEPSVLAPITRHKGSDFRLMGEPTDVVGYGIILKPSPPAKYPYYRKGLEYHWSTGDIIAIFGEGGKHHDPELRDGQDGRLLVGALVNEERCASRASSIWSERVLQLPAPLPTPEDRPALEFVDGRIPILAYALFLVSSGASDSPIIEASIGDRILVVSMNEQGPCQGIVKARSNDEHWRGGLVDSAVVARVPTPQERHDLEFLDSFTPVLYYARILSDVGSRFQISELVAIVADSDWTGRSLPYPVAVSLGPHDGRRTWDTVSTESIRVVSNEEVHRVRDFEVLNRV